MPRTNTCRNGARRASVSASGLPLEQLADAEEDEISRARVLDDAERDRRRHDQRRQPGRRRGDVNERADVDSRHRGKPGRAALLGALSDDVEHRGPGDEEQRDRRNRDELDGGEAGRGPRRRFCL